MGIFDFILIDLVLVLGIYLIVVGWVGTITGTAFIHRTPFGLNRPTLYILVVSIIFFNTLVNYFGQDVIRALFFCLIAAVIYETVHPLLSPSVEITGANPEVIDADIRDALTKLNLSYSGAYPCYQLPASHAELRVKYWRRLGQGKITVSPKSERQLLKNIEGIIDRDFNIEEQPKTIAGFKVDLIEGAILCLVAFWQLLTHF